MPMATKKEIRAFARDTRESLRAALQALDEHRFDDAEEMATQAAGCAGEVENLVQQYVSERGPNYRISGE